MNWIYNFLKELIEQLYKRADYYEIPPEVVMAPIPPNNLLNTFCLAIQKHEGWKLNPPSRSVRNNNAGNVKYSPVGYLKKYGKVGKDPQNFAIFETYELGFLYLKNLVLEKAKKHPTWTFYRFFEEYAPASDNNDSKHYAEVVAKACSVSPNTTLSIFL